MKKVFTAALLLLLALCLTACGAKKSSGMPNPMEKVASLEKLSEKASCALIKPTGVDVSNETYYMINGDTKIAQYTFTVNGTECTLRFANADITTDISGIYVEGGTLFADTEYETTYIENDDLKAQRWVTVDGQYIFVVPDKGAWDWSLFDQICTQFRDMEPKNWKSDVPFASYKALEGSYDDETGNAIGSINIQKDHAGLFVVIDQEDGSRLYWEMDAVLKDNQLVYEKETISSIVYDESKDETVTTPLEGGGAGSVEVKDGTLIFANAYSEQLKDLVLKAR